MSTMLSSLTRRKVKLLSSSPTATTLLPSLSSLSLSPSTQSSTLSTPNLNHQIRTKVTKTKQRRLLKKAANIPKRLPPNYIDPKTPIKISPTANRPSLALPPVEERLSHYLPKRSKELSSESSESSAQPLRFQFTSIRNDMSPKLQKLFHLSNASTSEVARIRKEKAMEFFQLRPGDTGSSAVQIVALTNRIQQVQTHVGSHRKDYSGKRGLDALYVKRRKMLDYLERKDYETYKTVVSALGLVR